MNVYLIGPDPRYPGGIQSVIATMLNFADDDIVYKSIPSWKNSASRGLVPFLRAILTMLYISVKDSKQNVWFHVHLGTGGSWVREGFLVLLSLALRKQTAVTLHGSSLTQSSSLFLSMITSLLRFKRVDFIITLTPDIFSRLRTKLPQTVLLPNPVPSWISKQFRKTKESKTIIFVGKIDSRKGVDVLLEAWLRVHSDFPEWQLEILGFMGDFDENLLKSASKYKVYYSLNVKRESCIARMSDCAALVLPSLREQSPIVIWEAMTLGVPVITTRLSGTKFQLGDSYPLLIEPNSIEQLKGALIKIMQDSAFRHELSSYVKHRSHSCQEDNLKLVYKALYN